MGTSLARPRVVIDARMVSKVQHGISRYVSHMAQGLERIRESLPYEPIFLAGSETPNPFHSFQTFQVQTPFLNPKEIFEIPKVLKKLNAALYHSPSFSSLWNCPCPSLVTLHDLNHLTYGGIGKKIYYLVLLRHFANRSKKILTVSQFSKGEISAWLKKDPKTIEVVYNSLSPSQVAHPQTPEQTQATKQLLDRNGLSLKKYFFCLSNSKPHKNIPFLISAYQNYRKQTQNPWPLVISTEELTPTAGVQYLSGLQENEARALLENSGGMLFPSLYEGFGLPPIEAVLLGTPLVVSRIPSHQEGLVDLNPGEVFWNQPQDLHAWTSAFHRLQKGEVSPSSEITRMKILDRFSIEKMAQKMDLIYRGALGVKL